MPLAGATRSGVDTAGGLISGITQTKVRVNGAPWATVGAAVANHGTGPHASAQMQGSPSRVRVGVIFGGLTVLNTTVAAGTPATCGHVATGSANVRVGV